MATGASPTQVQLQTAAPQSQQVEREIIALYNHLLQAGYTPVRYI